MLNFNPKRIWQKFIKGTVITNSCNFWKSNKYGVCYLTDTKLKGEKWKHEGSGHWVEKELRRGFLSRGRRVRTMGKGPESDERMQVQDDAEELLSMKRDIFHLEPWPGALVLLLLLLFEHYKKNGWID